MNTVRRSISGVRGTEAALTPAEADGYASAFGTYLRQVSDSNTILAGRDTRPTSPLLQEQVVQALLRGGWDVIDLGVVPTPTMQLAIRKFEAAGGAVVTASHNPIVYNGIKFLQNMGGHGMFLREQQVKDVFAIYDGRTFDSRRRGECRLIADLASQFDVPPLTAEYLSRTRSKLQVDNAIILDYHLHRVVSAMGRDLDAIRGHAFRVAMDCGGGAGIPIDFVFLDYLYAQLTRIGDVPGRFAREIEPAPANLRGLCSELTQTEVPYDIAFVTDCDNDRCVLVAQDPATGTYTVLEEDYTFAIAVDEVLGQAPPGRTVVTNWSTSQMIKDICATHHANLRRVPTGEVYTSSDAIHYHATIAGEGSCAGVIDPRVGVGRDALVGMWHVLAALAHKNQNVIEITRGYPRYEKANCDHRIDGVDIDLQAVIRQLQVHYAGRKDLAFMSREDGLIVAFANHSRIQVRASNTEPVLRIRAWSKNQAEADALTQDVIEYIGAKN
jgi:phosphomannomutase